MRILTHRWRKSFADPVTARTATVRAVVTWNTDVDINLTAWDGSGGTNLDAGRATSSTSGITDARVSADVKKFGPEQFFETSADATRNYAFGVCYAGNAADDLDRKTKVEVTLVQRDGSVETTAITLSEKGAGKVLRWTGTNVRPEVSDTNRSTWCPAGIPSSTAIPSVVTAPVLQNCGPNDGWVHCTSTSGTWTGEPTISYVPELCNSAATCGTNWLNEPSVALDQDYLGDGCWRETWHTTVIATNAHGQRFYPISRFRDEICVH